MITNILVVFGEGHVDGPWNAEPDYVEGYLQEFGCYMFVRRSPVTGALNGYVTVPSEHPWHGKLCDDLDYAIVHGNITYCGPAADVGCDKGGWAIGFDCAHAGDTMPAFSHLLSKGHYWNVHEVLCETLRLAVQAANSHTTDYERLVPLMHEAEYKCRISRPDGTREWVWEEPIRLAIGEEGHGKLAN